MSSAKDSDGLTIEVRNAQYEAAEQEEISARAEMRAAKTELRAARLEEEIANARLACAENREGAARASLELALLSGAGVLGEFESALAYAKNNTRNAENARKIASFETQRSERELHRAKVELDRAVREKMRVNELEKNHSASGASNLYRELRQTAHDARCDALIRRVEAQKSRAGVVSALNHSVPVQQELPSTTMTNFKAVRIASAVQHATMTATASLIANTIDIISSSITNDIDESSSRIETKRKCKNRNAANSDECDELSRKQC